MRSDADRALVIDKLCERWIFERGLRTAYELAQARLGEQARAASPVEPERLARFADEVRLHGEMLEQLLAELGRDPRHEAATPSMTLGATAIGGVVEILRADGLRERHLLEALYAGERLDGAGWDLLVELGKEADLDDEWLRSFRAAGREQREHEWTLRAWLVREERAILLRPLEARPL